MLDLKQKSLKIKIAKIHSHVFALAVTWAGELIPGLPHYHAKREIAQANLAQPITQLRVLRKNRERRELVI